MEPTNTYDEQVAYKAWHLWTTRGWTYQRVAEHLQVDVGVIQKHIQATSEKLEAGLSDLAKAERLRQISFYHVLIEELYDAWTKSKEGKKIVSRTTVKDQPPAMDGQPPLDLGQRVTSRQDLIASYGETNYLSMIRSCMHDLRALFSLHPTKKVSFSWQEYVPPGYDPESLARQFAEMMVSAQEDE